MHLSKYVFCATITLVGCSSEDGRTVTAGPLLCLLDADGSPSPKNVTCSVKVGDTTASDEGIDVSVTNILSADVLPSVCPQFSEGQVANDSSAFDAQVRTQLSDAYVRSGAGWTIQSVSCSFTQ